MGFASLNPSYGSGHPGCCAQPRNGCMQDDSNSAASLQAAGPERTGVWSTWLHGPFTRFGLAVGAIICVLDQASKLWMLQRLDLDGLRRIVLAPVLELVLVRNYGI